jgi:hypothetical protein
MMYAKATERTASQPPSQALGALMTNNKMAGIARTMANKSNPRDLRRSIFIGGETVLRVYHVISLGPF